jgi:hypothetical protein
MMESGADIATETSDNYSHPFLSNQAEIVDDQKMKSASASRPIN